MTMLSLDVYSASFRKPVVERTALHRLFAAAIVSDQFRKTLLREPEKALAALKKTMQWSPGQPGVADRIKSVEASLSAIR